ncbi:MAG TPA: hypothetical protein VGX28_08980 [Frankiaceae bacterium]|jgi:hypothetical protein|nr:hypothetical protein [Frankiaceae bacterium]
MLEPLGPPLGAYLGGSRAFGLGNALSDVDLTVVYAADADGQRDLDAGEVSLHCQVTTLARLAPLADLFAHDALPTETASVTADEVVGAHRRMTDLVRGTYVSSSPELDALRARFDVARVDRLSAHAAATLAALSVRDAAGAARSGDDLTEAAAAEVALEYAFDAALFAAGDPYRSRKFLPRRLARLLPRWLGEWRRERPVAETLLLANGLTAATLLGAGDAWTYERRGDGPCRSPYAALVATDSGLRLAGAVELSVARPAAIVWLLADGRPLGDLAARFAEVTGRGRDEVAAFVGQAVGSLAANGALQA